MFAPTVFLVVFFNVFFQNVEAVNFYFKFPPDFKGYLAKEIENLFLIMKDGEVPNSLQTLNIDTIKIPEISMEQGQGPIATSIILRDVELKGLGALKLDKIWNGFNKGNMSMIASATLGELKLTADYKMRGRIIIFPIAGDGKCTITLKKMLINFNLDNDVVKRKGKEYLRTKKFGYSMEPQDIDLQFENLFGKNVDLGRQMNYILNLNAKELFLDFEPAITKALSVLFRDVFNKVFAKTPYKNIFPSSE